MTDALEKCRTRWRALQNLWSARYDCRLECRTPKWQPPPENHREGGALPRASMAVAAEAGLMLKPVAKLEGTFR